MPRKPKPPRERAARALCRHLGLPEDTKLEGKPLWVSYLPEVDAVLSAAISPEAVAAMREAEAKTSSEAQQRPKGRGEKEEG